MSSKAKATGLFPNDTLSTKKKNFSRKIKDPNKISAPNLTKFGGSLMGLDFPSLKTARQQMFGSLQKNHEDLIIEGVEESSN